MYVKNEIKVWKILRCTFLDKSPQLLTIIDNFKSNSMIYTLGFTVIETETKAKILTSSVGSMVVTELARARPQLLELNGHNTYLPSVAGSCR